jgi:hypothetical protein
VRLAILPVLVLVVALTAVLVARAWITRAPAAPSIPAPTSTTSTQVAVPEDPTPEVRGHIFDADGNPVDGATVRLVSTSPPYTVYRDTKTDPTGAYSFAHAGTWRVRVVADHDPGGVVTSAAVQPEEGKVTEITLVLSPAGAVSGTVVDADDHPVAGAVLSVEGVPWIVPAATSDAGGAFRLDIVPQQAASLVAVARGYKTARVALGPRDDTAELVVVVRLTGAPPVDGEVRDAEGRPLVARIVACEDQPAQVRVNSGEDGAFQLPPSAIGCDAIAEHGSYASSAPVHVDEGRHVVLRLQPGGSIDGVVVDDRGDGVPSFTVGVESFTPTRGRAFGAIRPRKFDDPRGAFLWDPLAPGTYTLTAWAADRPSSRSAPIEVVGGVVTSGVRIVLARGGTVTGRVTDDRHVALGGVEIAFDAVSNVADNRSTAHTDDSGQYRLEGAPAGPFTLRAHKDGYRMRLVSGLRVDSGATLRQDVVLVAIDGGPGLELGGIGAALRQTDDGITLAEVFPGDPAGRAGLRAGDRILRIDGEPTQGMSMSDALQRLRGEAGTSVGVSAQRPDTGETVELTIVRGTIVH